jgi:hypothetical protein
LKIMKILIFTHIQEKCSEFQNQIDLRKIDELKKLLYEVTSMNLNITTIRPFTINKLFPLQKSKSFLPYPFFIGSELLLLRGIYSSSSFSTSFSINLAASYP